MRECLKQLAQSYEVTSIYQQLEDILNPIDEADEEPVAVPVTDFDLSDWQSGVEQFQDMTPEELWKALGQTTEILPYFNTHEDPECRFDPWSDEWEEWYVAQRESETPEWRKLQPRWHQLVGIFKMLINMFESRPVLLMDEVGVGKTVQVLGFVAMRAYLIEERRYAGTYPGYFGECHIRSPDCGLGVWMCSPWGTQPSTTTSSWATSPCSSLSLSACTTRCSGRSIASCSGSSSTSTGTQASTSRAESSGRRGGPGACTCHTGKSCWQLTR